ncbi:MULTISPECIES: hypothetical protein [Acinetobacter]|uniref:Uncharacterized protein n=1 Tax=Acinetobacter chengduensis TaxID=2420890 RepID=A0ABX9TRN2_9GAMM|nr:MULTISPECIES: hypothetical protein [Acinetobacter]MBI1453698.1 hypothetical protein [Acinetobacter sp. FL51]RLL16981.1 hypothetical protein D9K81_17665 [Acinetobacter chengduensis]
MIQPSLKAGLVQLRALADFIDLGSGNASFVYYESVKPASVLIPADDSAKLATLTLPKPCFKRLNEDSIELKPSNDVLALKTGTVVWARLFNASGDGVADFAMGTDIILNSYDIVMGATQRLDSIILKPVF